jgi:hypothetical protein
MYKIFSIKTFLIFTLLFYGNLFAAVEANFAASTASGDEDASPSITIYFTNTVSGAAEAAYGTLDYTVLGSGTATQQGDSYPDFNFNSDDVTLSGQTEISLNLGVYNDDRYELDETIIIRLESVTSANFTIGSTNVQTFTITDDETGSKPEVTLSTSNYAGAEGIGTTITVNREEGSEFGLAGVVNWAISNGSTVDGDHSSATSGSLNFTQGTDSKTFTYTSEDDAVDENFETFTITITTGNANVSIGSINTATFSIEDDDDPPTVGFSTTAITYGESQGSVTITAMLSAASGIPSTSVSVSIDDASTVNSSDHDLTNTQTINYVAGSQTSTETVSFNITQDIIDEPDTETLVVNLSSPNGLALDPDASQIIITITDDDAEPTVSVSSTATGLESVANPDVTVSLSAASGRDVAVLYGSTGGTATGNDNAGTDDYQNFTGQSLTISAGTTSNTFSFNVNNDLLDEEDETIIYAISSPTNAALGVATQTYTIQDDDNEPSFGFAAATSNVDETEVDLTHTVSAQLSAVSGKGITFDYVVAGVNATGGGTDFLLSDGSGTLSAGVTTYDFTPNIEGDALYEGNETFTITLSNISNASDGTLVHTVTIADNETTPTIGFSTDATNGQEATTSKSFTIQLNAVSGLAATVSYAATGGTATGGGTDYTLADGSVTIAANLDPPQATFDLAITDDVIDEIEETVIITLSSPGNATLGTTQLTYTINDDDAAPSLSFTSSTFSDDEDNTNGQFNIALSGASGKDITYGYTINTGTTTASAEGVDYTLTDGVGTITAGNTTANINFTVNDDAIDEENEKLVVTLDTDQFVNALLIGTPLEATYTITDNDNPPNIQFTDATSGMTEVDGTKNIEVSIASVSGKEVSVTVSDNLTGNATVDSDYTVNSQSYTIAAGQTTVNVPVNIPGDEADEDESAETVVLGLSGAANSTIVGNDTHTLTITDSDPEPTIIFTNAAANIQENIGNYTIDFNIDYKSYQDVSFDYSVANTSTAVGSGTDYTLANGTATITAGSLTGTITLPVNNDNLFENTETVVIDMSNPTNCSIGATPTTTIRIADNDNAPTVRFAVGADAATSDATSDLESISVTLSTVSGKETTIPYTIGDASTVTSTGIYADHNLVAGNLVIPIGSLTGNITYNPVVDNTYENDETLVIDLGTPTNATLNADGSVITHSVTFSSSDAAPTIGFSATSSNITETDDDAVTNLEIQLSARSEVAMSVYASGAVGTAESGDFSVNSGVAITIDASTAIANNLTADVPVTVVGDLIDEENQTFTVTLSSATDASISVGVSDVHTVTIVDNDAPPVVRIYYQGDDEVQAFDIAEGNGSFTFKVALAGATEKNVSIDYGVDALVSTTKLNQDYSGFASSGTFTLVAGVSSQDVTVTLTSDIVDEPDQTLKVDLVSGTETNATLSGTQNTITGTILDDDLPPYVYFNNSNSTQGNEGAAGVTDQVLLTVTMTDTSEQTVIIPYSLGGGTATEDVDFVLTDHSIEAGTAITIAPGGGLTTTIIQLDIVGDNSLENNQTVIVNLDAENVDGSDPYRLHPTFSTAHTYTIINDDTEPDVEFASATYTFDEDVEGATVTTNEITVTLGAASEVDATIDYAASDGTAVGTDYTVNSGTLTISAGEVSNTFTLSTLVDNIDEENETFTITLSNPDNASLGSQSTTTVTITDNDNPPAIFIGTAEQFTAGNAINKEVDEDVGATNFQVTLSTLSQKAISIDYAIDLTNSTAKNGQDYNSLASSGTVNLAAGETSTTLDFNILSDLVSEDAQTIIIEFDPLSAVNATADGAMYTGTMTIGDDDPAPKVYFNAESPTSANEGADGNTSTKTFQVTLSDTSEKIITIPFTVAGVANTNIAGVTWNAGPTAGGQDYTSSATTLTINPLLSLSSADIDITVIGDDIDEYDEVFTIALDTEGLENAQLHPSNATSWTYTITDDDDPPSASISAGAASAEENAPDATITLNTASEKSTSFTITTTDGTATLSADEGADGGDYFITASSVLALAPGVTEGVIDISGVDDVMYEGNETFSVTVAADSNASINTSTASFTLQDDDGKSVASFSGTSLFVDEDADSTIKIPMTLNKISGFDTDITYSIINTDDANAANNPADYSIVVSTLTIPSGQTSINIELDFIDDFSDEGNEIITFSIDDVGDNTDLGQFTTLALTIVDNDSPPADFSLEYASSRDSDNGDKAREGYWSSFHDKLFVSIPIGVAVVNVNLVGGSVQVLAKVSGAEDATYSELGDAVPITDAINGNSYVFEISETNLEAHADFSEGVVLSISARITDNYSNSTIGTPNATDLIIDQIDPAISTVTTVTSVGGVVVDGFWNKSNLTTQVTVPTDPDDNSILGGSIQLQAKVTEGNPYESIGTVENGGLITVTGAEIGSNVLMTADLAAYQALANYPDSNSDGVLELADGQPVYHTVLVIDAAGNERVYTESSSILTTDLVAPTLTEATSTENNGYFKVGDEVGFTVDFSEPVTGTTNTMIMTVALSSGANIERSITTLQRSDLAFNGGAEASDLDKYVVATSNTTFIAGVEEKLSVVSITSADGIFRDLAGNDIVVTTIDAGNNLDDSKSLKIDGVPPSDFTIGSAENQITTLGDPVVPYYWNSSNTGASISIASIEDEISLVDGSIQMIGIIDGTTYNIGDPVTILLGDLNSDKSITMVAEDIENNDSFIEGVTVNFSAIITDVAGNSTLGTNNANFTFLSVDQTLPEDLDLNDVYSRTDDGVITVPGYINSTNDAIIVETNVGNNDLNMTVQVQGRTELNPGVFTNDVQDQNAFTIPSLDVSQNDINAGYTQTIIPVSGGFIEKLVGESLVSPQDIPVNKTIYFRSILTDLAGNITTQAESEITAVYDSARIETIDITYSNTNVNQDSTITITATFSERPYYGFSNLTDSPHVLIDFPSGINSIDAPMEALFIGDVDGVPNAADTNYTIWTYELDLPNDNTDGTVNVKIHCTDIAGNPVGGYGKDNTDADCPEMVDFKGQSPCDEYSNQTGKDLLKIDNTAPVISLSYTNITSSDNPVLLGKGEDVINVVVSWNESPVDDNPVLTATFTDGSTSDLTFASKTGDDITYSMDLPNDPLKDGPITFSSSSSDAAGNNEFSFIDNDLFILDNTPPVITVTYPLANSSYQDLNIIGYDIDESNLCEIGTVTFLAVSESATDSNTDLDGESGELVSREALTISNPATLSEGIYDVTIEISDEAGNLGSVTISSVEYDITTPTVDLEFDKEFAGSNAEVILTASFSEGLAESSLPTFDLNYIYSSGSPTGDLIGERFDTQINDSTWTYTIIVPDNNFIDGLVTITFDAATIIDPALNELDINDVTNSNDLTIDNLGSEVTISYVSSFTDGRLFGNGDDNITVTMDWNEIPVIDPVPNLIMNYSSSGSVSFEPNQYDGNPLQWTYEVTLSDLPEDDDSLSISTDGTDMAGNMVLNYLNNEIFVLDNTAPVVDTSLVIPAKRSSTNNMLWSYKINDSNGALESANIDFKKVNSLGTNFSVELVSNELDTALISESILTNQSEIDDNIVDGAKYNIIFNTLDFAGNTGTDTVFNVKYDVTSPYASVEFIREYARQGMEDTVTVVFSEKMKETPVITLSFGLQDEWGLITEGEVITGDMTVNSDLGDSVWTFPFIVPPDTINNGRVLVWFDPLLTQDFASNFIGGIPGFEEQDTVTYVNSLQIDNRVSKATISYNNLSDSLLNVRDEVLNPNGFYTYPMGIGNHHIQIAVSMNIPIKTNMTPVDLNEDGDFSDFEDLPSVPSLSYWYNYSNDGLGDNVYHQPYDSVSLDSSIWFYDIILDDSSTNDGDFHVVFTARDKSGADIVTYLNTDIFRVDNIKPQEFLTGNVVINGLNPVQGWISSNTQSIDVKIPIPTPLADSTLYVGSSVNFPAPSGRVDIQLFNTILGTEFVTVYSDGISLGDPIDTPGDSIIFNRTIDNILTALPDGTDLIMGNTLQIRGVITDRHGNVTYGDIATLSSGDPRILTYDPISPTTGSIDYNVSNFGEDLLSSDTMLIQWSEFLDPGELNASGIDRYELAIEHVSDENGDLLGGPINNLVDWMVFSELPTNVVSVIDSLAHNNTYIGHIRAFDIAGNISDTLSSDSLNRINSVPVISPITEITLNEDISWNDIDSAIVFDADLNTLQGDKFSFDLLTERVAGPNETLVPTTGNVALIDTAGSMTWTPTQAEVGEYNMIITVTDNYGFETVETFSLIVLAVNDAPVLQFSETNNFEVIWQEDQDTTITLNQYLVDVDHNDSTEIGWMIIVQDTSQNDEDFPLGHVFSGPGITQSIHAKYTRKYLGFNPNMVITKGPTSANQMRNITTSISVDPLLEVSIDYIINGTDTSGYQATFNSADHYYGSDHNIIFIAIDPDGAEGIDTLFATIEPLNDPPVINDSLNSVYEVAENSSVKLEFGRYVTDVDNPELTFEITALTNSSRISISPSSYITDGIGDSVLFTPELLWSNQAEIEIKVFDGLDSTSSTFTLDVIRETRPNVSLAVIQNSAFTQALQVFVIDDSMKTKDLDVRIQNVDIPVDTIAPYTFTSNYNFPSTGNYIIDVYARGIVGDTIVSKTFALTAAKSASRWVGSSYDGIFSVAGNAGAVKSDKSFIIVDSSLFAKNFYDDASYVLGDGNSDFDIPIEVRIKSQNDDRAIYRLNNNVTWQELPSITVNGEIFTLSEKAGYFKLGEKTMIVPELTSLNQNYPNPFNPSTTISYDIGLMDGLSQNVSILVYNILGQEIATLVKNVDQIGQFKVRWDGNDNSGRPVGSGIYFMQLRTQTGIVKNKKMMLLK